MKRLEQIVDFLKKADRFHGAWPHWIYGETGKVKPFSEKDNGADIVETAYLIQGLLAVRQFFINGSARERSLLLRLIIYGEVFNGAGSRGEGRMSSTGTGLRIINGK